ncbi:DNA-binding transcriptional regulator, LysR family [Litoreibacter ascidiaceicola]|uniref:DNA-binding transcriptional regulator, LysR family n=1 Tax=Litoreibacter ascidiaceicola TaxID=1486859 RepID=A0A1M4ZJC8_9RHOB|nr:LysR family transcriptional regulator [Litoreibacter ascidiaceicola]SHF17917.1 DNA-binding transcriptional regulator, LysR family [Litoreibacter ascidiaceicola]
MLGNTFTLKQLEALVWVADLGSFRKAAQHLNTTQPNISSRIASLEATLGTILMQRDAGSVRLTDKGREILQAARAVLRQAEELIEVAARPDLVQNRLRLGVTELIAATWLHEYLRRLKAAYPEVSFELTVDLSRTLDRALALNELDLTLQTAPFATTVTGQIELGEYPYVWVASPAISAELPTKLTVKDLIPHTLLTHARHTQAFTELSDHADANALPKAGFVPSSSMSSCLQMTLDGMGVSLLPEAMVAKDIAAGKLVHLCVDWAPNPLRFCARYHAEKVARFVLHAARIAEETATDFKESNKH